MKCPYCGQETPDDSTFCAECGERLDDMPLDPSLDLPEDPDERKPRRKKKRQWKIILEDIDSWEKFSFVFYDTVGIGRDREGKMYEKYLSLTEDKRVSKAHCVIVRRGDQLFLKDEGSRNGTFLNGQRIEEPVTLQKDDIIGVGGTRLEVQRVLSESE